MRMRILLSLAAVLLPLVLWGALSVRAQTSELEVWYVPGWMKCAEPHDGDETWASFSKIFDGARTRFHAWGGNESWSTSRANADAESLRLANLIADMGVARTNLTLVGHSLGGRIVARTLARLAERDLKIRQGILMAAAIPNNDSDVVVMGRGACLPVLCLCNPEDTTLRFVYRVVGGESAAALGAGGALVKLQNVVECAVPATITKETEVKAVWGQIEGVRRIASHHALFYLAALRRIFDNPQSTDQQILIPQDRLNLELKVLDAGVWWDILASENGWKLERNVVTRHCRILNPRKERVAWGTESKMWAAFRKIKRLP